METTAIDLETPDDLLYRPKQEFSAFSAKIHYGRNSNNCQIA